MNKQEKNRKAILDQIGRAAKACRELETQFGRNPAPELETLIKAHRSLILNLSAEAETKPEVIKRVTDLMKGVMEWAALQEKRKGREFAEQKHRDLLAARKAEAERDPAGSGGGIPTETRREIEEDLNLM